MREWIFKCRSDGLIEAMAGRGNGSLKADEELKNGNRGE